MSNEYCIEYKSTDKNSIKICLETLEKIFKEAKRVNKIPKLVIGIRKSDNEMYMLTGEVSLEKCSKRK